MRILSFILVALLGTQLTACGGGSSGSSGSAVNTSAAVLSSDNAEDIGTGVSATVLQVVLNDTATSSASTLFSGSAVVDTNPQVRRALRVAIEQVESEEDVSFCSSGSMNFSGSETNMLITFSSCVIGEVTISGKVRMVEANGRMTTTFENLTVTSAEGTISISGLTKTCTSYDVELEDWSDCSTGSDYTISGQTYRTQNLSVTNSGDAFEVDGRIFASEFGYVDVTTTTPLVMGEDGTFISGELVISDESGNTLTITFSGSDVTICITTSGSETCDLLGEGAPVEEPAPIVEVVPEV